MPISRAEVEKVSSLARLRLSDEELERMTSQMGEILATSICSPSWIRRMSSRWPTRWTWPTSFATTWRKPAGPRIGIGQRPAERRGMLSGPGRAGRGAVSLLCRVRETTATRRGWCVSRTYRTRSPCDNSRCICFRRPMTCGSPSRFRISSRSSCGVIRRSRSCRHR